MNEVNVAALTQDRMAEALAVFRSSGWDEDSLFYVKVEMQAFFNGDVNGYIRAHFVMAIANDKVVGVAAWAPSTCSFWLYELSWATVLPEWRHRGINSLMLAERLRQIQIHRGPEAFSVLVCTWDNPMYARAGFVPMQPQGRTTPDKRGKCLLLAQFPDTAGKGL